MLISFFKHKAFKIAFFDVELYDLPTVDGLSVGVGGGSSADRRQLLSDFQYLVGEFKQDTFAC